MTESSADPIDLAHLDRQTMGDEALRCDVLRLFLAQAPETLERIRTADPEVGRKEAAHALVGAARAIGAFTLADAARAVEHGEEGPGAVEDAMAAALGRIAALLGGEGTAEPG